MKKKKELILFVLYTLIVYLFVFYICALFDLHPKETLCARSAQKINTQNKIMKFLFTPIDELDITEFFKNKTPKTTLSNQNINDITLAYIKSIEKKIKSNWKPERQKESYQVITAFSLNEAGELVSLNIAKSSGNPVADREALEAIIISAPFEKLPEHLRVKKVVPIEFTFDYNLIDNKKSF